MELTQFSLRLLQLYMVVSQIFIKQLNMLAVTPGGQMFGETKQISCISNQNWKEHPPR